MKLSDLDYILNTIRWYCNFSQMTQEEKNKLWEAINSCQSFIDKHQKEWRDN